MHVCTKWSKDIKEQYLPTLHIPQTHPQPEFGRQKIALIKISI